MKHVLLLAENNLQSNLIEKQLLSISSLEVQTCLPQEAIYQSHNLPVDLVLIDFSFLQQLDQQEVAPDFDLFGWSLMVLNVPDDKVYKELLRWKFLKGILMSSASIKHITDGVEYIFDGGLWLPRSYLETLLSTYRHSGVAVDRQLDILTSRERQVLELLAYGISNQQIASRLYLSESTIKSHIYKLYKKLDVHSRHDAIKMVRMNAGLTGP